MVTSRYLLSGKCTLSRIKITTHEFFFSLLLYLKIFVFLQNIPNPSIQHIELPTDISTDKAVDEKKDKLGTCTKRRSLVHGPPLWSWSKDPFRVHGLLPWTTPNSYQRSKQISGTVNGGNCGQFLLANLQDRNEEGKPCVPSVTIILFEINFCQTSLSFKQIFFKRPENINVKWRSWVIAISHMSIITSVLPYSSSCRPVV